MKNKLLYYSTNTYLSYHIASTFYSRIFYVWCSPVFDPSKLDPTNALHRIPYSSSPAYIYKTLVNDVNSCDCHSAKISENKSGLKKGALIKLREGVIDEHELAQINYIIDNAQISDFHPLLYVIPGDKIRDRLERVDVSEAANPLSVEFRIPNLLLEEFDIIKY